MFDERVTKIKNIMDTSDSEHFESADEEFQSDNETLTTINTKLKGKTENKHVDEPSNFIEETIIPTSSADSKVSKKDGSIEIPCNDRNSGEETKSRAVAEKKQKKERAAVTKLGTKLGAKITNKTNITEDKLNKTASDPIDCEKISISSDITSNEHNTVNKSKRPEFGIPPRKVQCWEEGVNAHFVKKNKPHESNQCELNSSNKNNDVGDIVVEKKQSESKRPEFGIPPLRATCWFEGVNNVPGTSSIETKRKEERLIADKINFDPKPKESEDMWENDEWETITESNPKMEDKELSSNKSSGWGGWSSFSSILNTATIGMSTITSHVSQGISTVLESGMGIPDPEEMARINAAEEKKLKQQLTTETTKGNTESKPDPIPKVFGLENLYSGVSQITKLVETTSNKVILGGLDTLETIGKKTMEVLQEGDPGLKKKRAFLKIEPEKPILSQLLREAKEKAEEENRIREEKHYARKANYETLFDDHQGLVHLEALEMLSKQCDIKLQSLMETYTGDDLVDMQETMAQVKELCELPDDDDEETFTIEDLKGKLDLAVNEINIDIKYNKLISTWIDTQEWLDNVNVAICNEKEIHEQAIDTLAQLTAMAVEQYHKCGELLLVKEHRSTADESDSLVQLTTTLISLIGNAAMHFSNKLGSLAVGDKKENVNSLITNVYFEAANSSSYIKNAFQLLLPVLQVGAV